MHQQLCDLRPVWQDHVRLQEQEIPSLKKRLEALDEKKSKLDAEIEQVLNRIPPPHPLNFLILLKLQGSLSELQKSEQHVGGLSSDLEGILRTYNEFLALDREVAAEQQKLSLSSSDTRSLEDVEKDLSEKQKRR